MPSLRKALRAAMQSLRRGQSLLLQALLACWGRRPALLRRRGRRRRSGMAQPAPPVPANDAAKTADVAVAAVDGPPPVSDLAALADLADPADPATTPATTPAPPSDGLSPEATAGAAAAARKESTSTSTSASASAAPSLAPSALSPNTTVASAATTPPSPSLERTPAAAFLRDAEQQLLHPLQGAALRRFARRLHAQLRDGLRSSPASMLPSHTTQLPTGRERGRYLTLDVGGSTLRVAVIALGGSPEAEASASTSTSESGLRILQIESFKITPDLKQLPGTAFFDWMAARIVQTVDAAAAFSGGAADGDGPLPMGLAWSFPLEQTSARGGRLQGMGKGFVAADTLLGHDLGDLIEAACRARGLAVRLAAIVNDAPAALLSTAYALPRATRFGLILGTGVNMAVHVPLAAVGPAKLAGPGRDAVRAPHVLVNTELGMFGGHGILPLTRWDALLNAGHPKPLFQPLEHLVSGYYLGEVVRFALLDAAAAAGLFGGGAATPPSLREPYALDTETLSRIAAAAEADPAHADAHAAALFHERHPGPGGPPAAADMAVVRALAALVAQRSAALVAAAIYALWALKVETETERVQALEALEAQQPTPETAAALRLHRAERDAVRAHTVVGFNGSVIEQYPQYRAQCQAILNELLLAPPPEEVVEADSDDDDADGAAAAAAWSRQLTAGGPPPVIDLVPAHESSLQGAAVALACLEA